ncbi:hypothetical protein [Streptomyces sp. NPDC001296]
MRRDQRLVGLWVAVSILFGLFIGAATALIRWSDDHQAAALLTGGAGCGGTITLALVVINTLRRGPS